MRERQEAFEGPPASVWRRETRLDHLLEPRGGVDAYARKSVPCTMTSPTTLMPTRNGLPNYSKKCPKDCISALFHTGPHDRLGSKSAVSAGSLFRLALISSRPPMRRDRP